MSKSIIKPNPRYTEAEIMETPMSDNDAKLLQKISRIRAQGGENAEAEIQKILDACIKSSDENVWIDI